jgi:hypothetical protein
MPTTERERWCAIGFGHLLAMINQTYSNGNQSLQHAIYCFSRANALDWLKIAANVINADPGY